MMVKDVTRQAVSDSNGHYLLVMAAAELADILSEANSIRFSLDKGVWPISRSARDIQFIGGSAN